MTVQLLERQINLSSNDHFEEFFLLLGFIRCSPWTVNMATPSDVPASLEATHLYSPASELWQNQEIHSHIVHILGWNIVHF